MFDAPAPSSGSQSRIQTCLSLHAHLGPRGAVQFMPLSTPQQPCCNTYALVSWGATRTMRRRWVHVALRLVCLGRRTAAVPAAASARGLAWAPAAAMTVPASCWWHWHRHGGQSTSIWPWGTWCSGGMPAAGKSGNSPAVCLAWPRAIGGAGLKGFGRRRMRRPILTFCSHLNVSHQQRGSDGFMLRGR